MANSWGEALWDQQGVIEKHTQENIEFVNTCRGIVSQVAQIEQEYGRAMRKLADSHRHLGIDDNSTCMNAFKAFVHAVGAMGQSHEQISSSLLADVCTPLKALQKRKVGERGELLKAASALHTAYEKNMQQLDKVQKKYDKIEKEEQAARAASDKAEETDTLPRAKQEKLRAAWVTKAKARDAFEQTLRQEYSQANNTRSLYYHVEMPGVFNNLQAMDENRAQDLVVNLNQVHGIYLSANNADNNALAQYKGQLDAHDKSADSASFARSCKSGKALPAALNVEIGYRPRQDTITGSPRLGRSPKTHRRNQPQTLEEEDVPAKEAPPPPPPSVQQCVALYDFPGSNPGELACSANETLLLVSNDGSGWVLCGKLSGERGYVPETYLQL